MRGSPAPPPGLFLPTRTIRSISGPVSMYYLHPPSDQPSYPLVLLFGDIHRDRSDTCPDCSSNVHCAQLHDTAFLEELDHLASYYPVDFYTEYSHEFPSASNPNDLLFHHFLQHATAPCHVKADRSKRIYRTACPTRKIRWHYTDVRFMRSSVAGTTPVIEGNLLFDTIAIVVSDTFFLPLEKLLHDATAYPDPTQVIRVITAYQQKHLRSGLASLIFTRSPLAEVGYIAHSKMYTRLLAAGLQQSTFDTVLRWIIAFLFGMLQNYASTRQSLIFKQMQRLPAPLNEPERWKEMILTALLQNVRMQSIYTQYLSYIATIPGPIMSTIIILFMDAMMGNKSQLKEQQVTEFRAWLPTHAKKRVLHTVYMYLYNIVLYIQTIFVDVYTIMRMFKPLTDSTGPLLALGYHGANHTRNMVSILTHPLFRYTVRYQQEADGKPLLRCITIQEHLPLISDLSRHAQRSYQDPRRRNALDAYWARMREERHSRIANTPAGENRGNRNMYSSDEDEDDSGSDSDSYSDSYSDNGSGSDNGSYSDNGSGSNRNNRNNKNNKSSGRNKSRRNKTGPPSQVRRLVGGKRKTRRRRR